MPKWYCTDCEDTFNDETGERCLSCGFRRVVGPVKYSGRQDLNAAMDEKKRRRWDEGEHEGCGIDSERAFNRWKAGVTQQKQE